ncbi:hypothetical protein ACWEQP_29260 [Streptomyces sp. NPDC004044]
MPIPLGSPFLTPLRSSRTVPGSGHRVAGLRLNGIRAATPFDGHGELLYSRAEKAVRARPPEGIDTTCSAHFTRATPT